MHRHSARSRLDVSSLFQKQFRIGSFQFKPMYGVPLKSHLEVIGRDIAVPLEECCSVMYLSGIKEEGLLRINGSSGTFSFSIGD